MVQVTGPFIYNIKEPFHQYKEREFKHRPFTILQRVYDSSDWTVYCQLLVSKPQRVLS